MRHTDDEIERAADRFEQAIKPRMITKGWCPRMRSVRRSPTEPLGRDPPRRPSRELGFRGGRLIRTGIGGPPAGCLIGKCRWCSIRF